MASPFLLYGKPLAENTPLAPLQIVGEFPDYTIGDDFEGRLDILNSIGKCRVEIVEASLPGGHFAYVDQITKEVVLKWPAFVPEGETDMPILNWDFSYDDLRGWQDPGNGAWNTGVYPRPGGENKPAASLPNPSNARALWFTGKGRGQHFLYSDLYPAHPGQVVTAMGLWDQGPSNAGNNDEYTCLQFYDSNKKPLGELVRGNKVHENHNYNRWWSSVAATTPPGAAYQAVAFEIKRRNGRNRDICVSDIRTEGFRYKLGSDDPIDYSVTLKVTDSANRVAYWSGILWYESIWMTSALLPLLTTERPISIAATVTAMHHYNPMVPVPDQTEAPISVSAEVTDFRHYTRKFNASEEMSVAAEVSSFKHYNLTIPHTEDAVVISAAITGFQHYNLSTYSTESISISAAITGFSHE